MRPRRRGLALHAESHETGGDTRLFLDQEAFSAHKISLVPVNKGFQPGLEGGVFGGKIGPVEGKARFEAEGVACSQTAGKQPERGAGLEKRFPPQGKGLRGAKPFKSVFSRVARASEEHGAIRKREGFQVIAAGKGNIRAKQKA